MSSLLLVIMLGLPLVMMLLLGLASVRMQVIRLLWLAPSPGLLVALAGRTDVHLGTWQFTVGPGSAMLLGASALIWCAAGACASAWLTGRTDAARFALWWLLTLWGSLGVFVAADLLSFYLLYAAASLPAYGLIVWGGGAEERRSGKLTVAAALLGEALLLAAFVLLAAVTAGQSLLIEDCVRALVASPYRDAVIALVMLGFGLKIGLVPLHGWMPLSYASGPLFATAALSGATSKAGIIGLVRFLPFDTPLHGWGLALLGAGLLSALYGAIVGLLQSNPRSVLAYSSISQLGQMAAVLGAGLAAGTLDAALLVSFYAVYHVLTKGGLFLALDAVRDGPRKKLILVTAAIAGLGFAGLPLTGGALGKLALKPVIGEGLSGLLFAAAACASTLLMLHFIRLIRAETGSAEGRSSGPIWIGVFAVAMSLPWLLFSQATGYPVSYALWPSNVIELGWPVALGVALSWLLSIFTGTSRPATGVRPSRDPLTPFIALVERECSRLAAGLAALEFRSRGWSVSTILLMVFLLSFTVLATAVRMQ